MTSSQTPVSSSPRMSPVAAQVGDSAPAGGVDGGQDVSDPRTLPAVDTDRPEVAFHPVADIFPMMSDRELAALTDDIRENGVHQAVWLHADGRLIDGRNRMKACRQLGIMPAILVYDGADSDLVAFVLSLNLHRRHLSESQRAMVAARVANLTVGSNQHQPASIEAPSVAQREAAEMLNVGRASVQRAKKVLDRGGDELAALVDSGELAVSAAASVAEEVAPRVSGMAPADAGRVVADLLAEKRAKAEQVREHNEFVRQFNETVEPSVVADIGENGRRLDAVNRIADACEELLRAVAGTDPERAVREALDSNRGRLHVVHDGISYLTRVADALTLEVVAA